jgi:RimJ/RimL family protein N-acetyltransferase
MCNYCPSGQIDEIATPHIAGRCNDGEVHSAHWPLFDLRVRTPRLTLQYADDELAVALADLAARGVHDPATMPFNVPWTDVAPPLQQRNTLQHLWSARAEWRPDAWHCTFAVLVDGVAVGVQGVLATDFSALREASTGSWLGLDHQGKGIGTEMRQAVLHLLFAGLGAEYARSGAFDDNARSLGVSAKLPYEPAGRRRILRRGEPASITDLRMSRDAWSTIRRDDITIEGLAPCLEMFGLPPSA